MAQITIIQVRELLQKLYAEEISFSYMVEQLNKIAQAEPETPTPVADANTNAP